MNININKIIPLTELKFNGMISMRPTYRMYDEA